jgi:hypothetical protein
MPSSRQTSPTTTPPSTRFKAWAICSTVNLLIFILGPPPSASGGPEVSSLRESRCSRKPGSDHQPSSPRTAAMSLPAVRSGPVRRGHSQRLQDRRERAASEERGPYRPGRHRPGGVCLQTRRAAVALCGFQGRTAGGPPAISRRLWQPEEPPEPPVRRGAGSVRGPRGARPSQSPPAHAGPSHCGRWVNGWLGTWAQLAGRPRSRERLRYLGSSGRSVPKSGTSSLRQTHAASADPLARHSLRAGVHL